MLRQNRHRKHTDDNKKGLDIFPEGVGIENTQTCEAAHILEERKEPSRSERSGIRYTQRGDARDTTSDRERWKVADRRREI